MYKWKTEVERESERGGREGERGGREGYDSKLLCFITQHLPLLLSSLVLFAPRGVEKVWGMVQVMSFKAQFSFNLELFCRVEGEREKKKKTRNLEFVNEVCLVNRDNNVAKHHDLATNVCYCVN